MRNIHWNSRLIAIRGSRGVGKTTLMIERFYLQGGKHLFLDEVHKYPAWSKELKEAYELYPSLRIVFSGSSLLNILNADADLSRRCLPYNMYGLSFREFLA